jgi:hypothetical protein
VIISYVVIIVIVAANFNEERFLAFFFHEPIPVHIP